MMEACHTCEQSFTRRQGIVLASPSNPTPLETAGKMKTSHVPHVHDSCTYDWVMSSYHTYECVMSFVCPLPLNRARAFWKQLKVYEWVMSDVWTSHVPHVNVSYTYDWVMSHLQPSQVTHVTGSRYTYTPCLPTDLAPLENTSVCVYVCARERVSDRQRKYVCMCICDWLLDLRALAFFVVHTQTATATVTVTQTQNTNIEHRHRRRHRRRYRHTITETHTQTWRGASTDQRAPGTACVKAGMWPSSLYLVISDTGATSPKRGIFSNIHCVCRVSWVWMWQYVCCSVLCVCMPAHCINWWVTLAPLVRRGVSFQTCTVCVVYFECVCRSMCVLCVCVPAHCTEWLVTLAPPVWRGAYFQTSTVCDVCCECVCRSMCVALCCACVCQLTVFFMMSDTGATRGVSFQSSTVYVVCVAVCLLQCVCCSVCAPAHCTE